MVTIHVVSLFIDIGVDVDAVYARRQMPMAYGMAPKIQTSVQSSNTVIRPSTILDHRVAIVNISVGDPAIGTPPPTST